MTLAGRVSPFGHPRIKAPLPAPRGLTQACTSFIACDRQGIHHMHLLSLDPITLSTSSEDSRPKSEDRILPHRSPHSARTSHYKFSGVCRSKRLHARNDRYNQTRFVATSSVTTNLYFFQFLKNNRIFYPKGRRKSTEDLFCPLSSVFWLLKVVELDGIEPTTPCLQSRCSPS